MYLQFTQDLIDFFWGSMVPFVDLIPGVFGLWLIFYFIRKVMFGNDR